MSVRFHLCLWVAALLVSCDKQGGAGNPAAADESRGANASRPAREKSPSTLQELHASLKVAMTIESPEARDQSLAAVARNSLKLAPAFSAEAIKQLSADSGEKTALLRYCAKTLMERNPDEALTWAASLGSDKDIAAAKAEIALVLMASDLAAAIKLISPSAIAESAADGAAVQVIRQWTSDAPEDAAAWVVKFPPGDSRNAGIQTVASRWVIADSEAATTWMAALDNEAARKAASRAMAEALGQQPPFIREALLEPADPAIRADLEQQLNQIKQEQEKANPPPGEEPE